MVCACKPVLLIFAWQVVEQRWDRGYRDTGCASRDRRVRAIQMRTIPSRWGASMGGAQRCDRKTEARRCQLREPWGLSGCRRRRLLRASISATEKWAGNTTPGAGCIARQWDSPEGPIALEQKSTAIRAR